MSDATTLTSKGQVTVPQTIRNRMGLKSGDKLHFVLLSDGTLIVRPKTRSITDLAGLLHTPGRAPVPLEDMVVDLSRKDQKP